MAVGGDVSSRASYPFPSSAFFFHPISLFETNGPLWADAVVQRGSDGKITDLHILGPRVKLQIAAAFWECPCLQQAHTECLGFATRSRFVSKRWAGDSCDVSRMRLLFGEPKTVRQRGAGRGFMNNPWASPGWNSSFGCSPSLQLWWRTLATAKEQLF